MLRKIKKLCVCFLAAIITAVSLSACTGSGVKDAGTIETGGYSTGVSVHDPSIFKDGENYYIFGSHMEAAKSTDLMKWSSFASGVNSSNPLFKGLFESDAFGWVGKNSEGGYSVWAPDVIYNKDMKKYCMYFCTTSSWNKSSVCLAVSDSAEGPYEFQCRLVDSGFTSKDADQTTVVNVLGDTWKDRDYCSFGDYNSQEWPNALDPSVFYDKDGRLWMVYGSWSGGIFMLELDRMTGLPIHPEDDPDNGVDAYFGKHILGYGHVSCEGPYILYDEESGYYYLFVSYGELTSEGGYQIRMFRSENPDGPYTDAAGQTWTEKTSSHGDFGVKLLGNYMLPSLEKAYMAPGHNSAFVDEDGRKFLIYHTRFDDGSEYHEPRVHQMYANKEGWLTVAPFALSDTEETREEISKTGYSEDEMCGTWQILNMGSDISSIIHKSKEAEFTGDGKITGETEGNWEYEEGTCFGSVSVGETVFKGVFERQTSEAGQPVICFTGVSGDNLSLWAVRYLEE